MTLSFTVEARCGAASTGTVTTARETFATPCFMPVGTRGAVRTLASDDFEDLGAEIVLGNTYHLMLRPGAEVVARLGGLHGFSDWRGHVLTDSGGYQVFSLKPKVDDEGATFSSTYDGSIHHLSPEGAVDVQVALGSDIQMVLDVCPPLPSPEPVIRAAVDRTALWAGRARKTFLAHERPDLNQFGIEQGGVDLTMRAESAERTVAVGFDGYAVGGLSVGEDRSAMLPALEAAVAGLPADRPRYFMGLGDPSGIVEAVARGIDMFDCVLPTRLGRHGTLLTSQGREMLRGVRTLILDEVHAVAGTKRGAHLALSVERLQRLVGQPVQRVGLSATQRPLEEIGRFVGGGRPIRLVDAGTQKELDLRVVVSVEDMREPGAGAQTDPLLGTGHEGPAATSIWPSIYPELLKLVEEHRTTIVFVNTRRLAERVARSLSERLGPDAVTAHHGSLSKEVRLDAEERLKTGKLKALVATASLELGIDIGHVDLVCQIASPHRVATLLQRVGRSGHSVGGRPKGRIFPLTRDDLIECAAILRCVRAGELDHLRMHEKPLDVLAQQIVAETAAEEWPEQALFDLVRRAYPYRDLERAEFDEIVSMVSTGFSTQRGRRGALVHHDAVNGMLRGRKGARLTAITSGGAIPEVADYRVVVEPEGTFVGTLNEDFAIESNAGEDIVQLVVTDGRRRVTLDLPAARSLNFTPDVRGRLVDLAGPNSVTLSLVEIAAPDDEGKVRPFRRAG